MRTHETIGRFARLALAGAVATAWALPAAAQIEEVVVTAQKREQSVLDVGLTVSALSEETLRETVAGSLDRLAGQFSNVQSYAPGAFIQTVHVRGIGLNEFQGVFDAPIATHVDEVYFAKPWMLARPMYDVSRVEVLKGPQGTLFGRNTTGGALNWYTNQPTDTFQAVGEIGFDNFERYNVQGAVSGPLGESLKGRLAFNTAFGSGGPQDNLFTGDEHGKPNIFDARGQLVWERENLKLHALMHGGINKSEVVGWKAPGIYPIPFAGLGTYCPEALTGAVSANPGLCSKFGGLAIAAGRPEGEFEPIDKFTINQNTPPAVDDEFMGGFFRFDYDLGWATLTSITAYEYYQRNQREDSQSDIFTSTSTSYFNEMNQINQELRLTGQFTDAWRYVAGFYYQSDDLDGVEGSDLSGQILPVLPPFATQLKAEYATQVDSIAMFFHSEYDFTENLTVNAGVRYTQDSTEATALLSLANLPLVGDEDRATPCLITTFPGGPVGSPACPFLGPLAPNGGVFEDNRTDSNVSWRLGAQYDMTEEWMLYGNLTTGYRAGGYSLPFGGAATQFNPETLFSQEIGVKGELLDKTLQITAAVFKYNYDDVQLNVNDPVISPLVPITTNAGDQETKGLEVEAAWQPTERWFFKQGIGYLDARMENSSAFAVVYGGAFPVQGKRPPNSPEWTYNGVARYQQPVFGAWDGILVADYRWVDDRFLEISNQPYDFAEAYWVANARAALATRDGRWEIAAFVKNVFNEEYITYINNISFFKLDIYGEQRSYGMNLRYKFE